MSRYYLDSQSASSGRCLFGRFRSGTKVVESKEVEDKGKPAAEVRKEEVTRKQEEAKAAAGARKLEAERKREETRDAFHDMPSITNWKMNKDGSITGKIMKSRYYATGEIITTSKIANEAVDGSVVTTVSGSRYVYFSFIS